jgi:PsbN protein
MIRLDMEPATVLSIAIAAFVVAITGLAIYTSFGPPSKELSDPFEDHED